jgi:uncharacterized Ntn-hydrolase superfamily protein
MSAKVKVIANENGAVINQSTNNPEYGYVKIVQVRTLFDDNGFLRAKPVNALIQGRVEELQLAGFYAGQELPGKIVIKESLTAFNDKAPERDLKMAGQTGIVCSFEGQPIYRKTTYSASSNAEDTLVQHDNVDELRAAYETAGSTTAMKANTDFDNL